MFKPRILLLATAFIMASAILSGCGDASPSPTIQISDIKGIQDGDQVVAGSSILLYVDASGSGQLSYTWEDATGTLQSDNRSSLNYTVPSTPGQTFIKVTVRTGNTDEKTKQVRFTIIASQAAGTNTPIIIPTVSNTDTPVPPMPTNTDSPIPSTVPVTPKCFDGHVWAPYEPDNAITMENDCWNLLPWGLSEEANTIFIQPGFILNVGQSHGIYTPIPTNCRISFEITVNKFTGMQSLSGNIGAGIISMDPIGPGMSRLLYYHYIYPSNNISIKTGIDGQYANILPKTLDFSKPQTVEMVLDGRNLTISIDNQPITTMDVPLAKRAFWISYTIPESSQLNATISNIEIH